MGGGVGSVEPRAREVRAGAASWGFPDSGPLGGGGLMVERSQSGTVEDVSEAGTSILGAQVPLLPRG